MSNTLMIKQLEEKIDKLTGKITILEESNTEKDKKIYELEIKLINEPEEIERWKNLYLNEVKNYLSLQQNYRSLSQDIKYHIEYNFILENKYNELEKEYLEIFSNYHKKLGENRIEIFKLIIKQIEDLKKTKEFQIDSLYKIIEKENKTYNEERDYINNQIEIKMKNLSYEKEDLQREIMMIKSHLLELSEKLESEINENIILKQKINKNNKII